MADTLDTAANILKLRCNDQDVPLLYEPSRLTPLMNVIAARSVPSNVYTYGRVLTLPTGGFRTVGNGADFTAGTMEQVTVNLSFYDCKPRVDSAAAPIDPAGKEAYLGRLAYESILAGMKNIERNILLGDSSGGFAGMAEFDELLYADSAMVVDAGGDTASTTRQVFAFRNGVSDCHVVWGNDGIWAAPEWQIIELTGANSKTYLAYAAVLGGWAGLQVGTSTSAGRIVNIDYDHKVDDDMLADLYGKFDVGGPPDYFVMNLATAIELQKSRTATTATGAYAEFPRTGPNNVPIIVVDESVLPSTLEVVADEH